MTVMEMPPVLILMEPTCALVMLDTQEMEQLDIA